jgi:hypothetical protein
MRGIRAASLACVLAGACARHTAPPDFLPKPQDAGRDAHGGWVELTHLATRIEGELLAVGADSVWVLRQRAVVALATRDVSELKVTGYAASKGPLIGWTALGSVSTASHGFFLVLSLPTWVIVGVVSTAAETNAAQLKLPRAGWADLARYARFPQGLPPGFRP